MKRKNIIFVSLLILFGFSAMQSCTKVDNTTYKTDVTYAVPTEKGPIAKTDGTFYCGADSVLNIEWSTTNNVGLKWDVYFGASKQPPLVQTGVADTKYQVTVTGGIKYYWRVEATDANGVVTSSPVFNFTPITGTNPKIVINLTCETDIKAQMDLDYVADDVVDLRLLIINKETGKVDTTVDAAAANEVYRALQQRGDSTYIIAVDLFSTIDAGALKKTLTLDLSLKFTQQGIIDTTLEFPGVMTDANTCALYRTNLAEITKSNKSHYAIKKAVSYWVSPLADPSALAGTWQGWDGDASGTLSEYPSQIVSNFVASSGKVFFDKIGTQWMHDDWGEIIITHPKIYMNFNFCTQTINIPSQKIMTTTYLGAPQPAYNIVGTGTFDLSGTYPVMNIHYDFVQNGHYIAVEGFGIPYFEADLTLDPAGLKVIKPVIKHTVKPVRHPLN